MAKVPSFRFLCCRSVFCTLGPVFGTVVLSLYPRTGCERPGNIHQNQQFGNHPFAKRRLVTISLVFVPFSFFFVRRLIGGPEAEKPSLFPGDKVFLGRKFRPRPWDVPDKSSMQGAFFCCFRQGVVGMFRDLDRDVPGSEKLFARKLWADFSFPMF